MDKTEYFKLLSCQSIAKNKRKLKATFVAYKGGFCIRCGYCDSQTALCFHHRDPTQKEFSIADQGHVWKPEQALEELDKCDLLCLNCHAEVHDEISKVQRLERKKQLSIIARELNIKKASREIKKFLEPVKTNTKYVQASRAPLPTELEKLLKEVPVTRIAELFGVSPNAVKKWCNRFGLETPPRGYWQKLQATRS